jgi:dTMP kinase
MVTGTGRFITFEGLEGAGKSTQIPLIAKWLESKGQSVVMTREPGGTDLGEKIRTLLLHDAMDTHTELLLVFAARAEHIARIIKPALAAGHWVLCDRFTEASYAYQGGGRQLGFEKVATLEKWLQGDMQPDITFWFDLPIEIGLGRIKSRNYSDRFEQEKSVFFGRVAQSYQERAALQSKRIQRVDAVLPIDEITQSIQTTLSSWFESWRN